MRRPALPDPDPRLISKPDRYPMLVDILRAIGYLAAAIVVAFGVWALCVFLAVQ